MKPYPIDHIAFAVSSIEDAAAILQRVSGETGSPIETLPEQGVRVAFLGSLELIEPTDPNGTVARFLERRGPGLHHIAYRVPNLPEALERARAQGLELIDPEPRIGAGGHRVAFLHPRSTAGVLLELVEAPNGASSGP